MDRPRRIPLICKPTPIHRLDRLSAELGIDLWIKRDDLTGFAMGGNKGRKLEYLMAAAKDAGAEVVVSCGSSQSNFVRQLGAACSVLGMHCAVATMALPYEDEQPVGQHLAGGGNLTLDELLGIDVRILPDGTWDELFAATSSLADEYRSKGKRVYEIPIGGSSPLGALGFVDAGAEIDSHFDVIVTPTSSGSTHAGLGYYFHGKPTRVVGIACDPEPGLTDELARIAAGLDLLTGERKRMVATDFEMWLDWVGPGYGVPSELGDQAIERLARTEGIFLDPIYSGKAFSGLLGLVEAGEIGGRVLFWHTGGVPTLFAR